MRDYPFSVNPNEKDTQFVGPSNYIRVESSAVPVRIETSDGRTLLLSQGDAITVTKPFERIYISHASVIAQPVRLLIGFDIEKLSSTFSGVVTGSVSITQATVLSPSLVSVLSTPTLIAVADSTRRGLRFQNRGSTAMYLGDSGVAVTTGILLLPNRIWIEDEAATPAWYAVVPSGAHSMRVQGIF